MSTPSLSVILPIYNSQRYLELSIDSVLAQSFGDFELLIHDDCSSDRSVDIVEAKKDPRIQLMRSSTNQGLFKSLNILARQARGELIRIWTHDDIMKPQCLETEQAFIRKHPGAAFYYCSYDIIDAEGKQSQKPPVDTTPPIISPQLAAQIMFYYGSIAGNISTVTIPRRILLEKGPFREDMRVAGDFELWARLSENSPVGFIHQPLIYLRSHAGQFSRWKGVGTDFLREEEEIYKRLFRRLPAQLQTHAKRRFRHNQLLQYTHYLISALARGEFSIARETARLLSRRDNLAFLIFLWLVTANNRFFKVAPRFIAES